jgi:hypothetical protein
MKKQNMGFSTQLSVLNYGFSVLLIVFCDFFVL